MRRISLLTCQWLRFYFYGNGATNYGKELIHLACDILWNFTPALRDAVFENYLVNPSGMIGQWFGCDLHQEHNNFRLKNVFNGRLAGFDSSFLQEAVSLNILKMHEVCESLFSRLGLAKNKPGRLEADIHSDINFLGQSYLTSQHHIFTPGRCQTFIATDAFSKGLDKICDGAHLT